MNEKLVCSVSARAVSGLLESSALEAQQLHLLNLLQSKDQALTATPVSSIALPRFISRDQREKMRREKEEADACKEGTQKLLMRSFHANSSFEALASAIQPPSSNLVQPPLASTSSLSPNKRVGQGFGSGAVFDAGIEWMQRKVSKDAKKRAEKKAVDGRKLNGGSEEERLVNGRSIVIPSKLTTMAALNEVLNQDRATLPLPTLKKLLQKSRASETESRKRALAHLPHRRLIRSEDAFTISLADILSDERLNAAPDRDFFSQREIEFLAEISAVEQRDNEVAFRLSDDFVGGTPLTEREIATIREQRAQVKAFAEREHWRSLLQSKEAEDESFRKTGCSVDTMRSIKSVLKPSFDEVNSSVWAKRFNVRQRFIRIVSTVMTRLRAAKRVARIQKVLEANHVKTRGECTLFVENENIHINSSQESRSLSSDYVDGVNKNPLAGQVAGKEASPLLTLTEDASLAEIIVSEAPNVQLQDTLRKLSAEVSRVKIPIFPAHFTSPSFFKYHPSSSEVDSLSVIKKVDVIDERAYDDRVLLSVKITPEFKKMGYSPLQLPPLAVFQFDPRAADSNGTSSRITIRKGAAEECVIRESLLEACSMEEDEWLVPPSWLKGTPNGPSALRFNASERDMFSIQPDLRFYYTQSDPLELLQQSDSGDLPPPSVDNSLRSK